MITNTQSVTHFLTTPWFAARVRFRAGAASVRNLQARWADFRSIGATLPVILLAAMMTFSPVTLAATRWVTVQLTDDDVRDAHTLNTGHWSLSDTCVVWRKGGDFETQLYDDTEVYALRLLDGVIPTMDDVVRITTNSVDDSYPAVNDDCLIAWRQDGDTVIVNDWMTEVWRASNRYHTTPPLINSIGQVAWLQKDPPSSDSDWDVFLYDGDAIQQLTTNLYDEEDWDFRIADNGDMVWLGQSDIADAEVFLYQGVNDPPALTNNDHDEDWPNINSLGQLVWTDEENPNAMQVKRYDGISFENVFPASLGGVYTPKPRINDNGYIVADIMGPDNFLHVYMYDPSYGGSVRQLTSGPEHSLWPAINNHQQVVWYAKTRYSVFNGDSTPGDIFLDDNGRRIRLTWTERPEGVPLPNNSFPVINDQGYVMWIYDVWPNSTETSEIMLAVPVEVPTTRWAATYGNEDWDAAVDVIETDDGGYLIAANTRHVTETESAVPSETDAWLVKLDHDGAIEWEKRYGGSEQDVAACVHETDDGYVMAGTTASFGAGGQDAWLVKVNKTGGVIWEKAYGALNDEEVACMDVTYAGKGDYVVATTSNSFASGGDFTHPWVFKVDKQSGDILWQKVYTGSPYDRVDSIEETRDGGFVIGGTTHAPELGNGDFWVLKLDEDGAIEWQKAYGQNEWVPADPFFSYSESNAYVRQTWDGGYILAGTSTSNNTSAQAAWILKLDPDGVIEWEKWGGASYVTDVRQNRRGDYVVLGRTGDTLDSSRFDRPRQGLLMKLDDTGEFLWEGTYTRDPTRDDELEAIVQTWDDGYIAVGVTSGGERDDAWVLKLSSDGTGPFTCDAVQIDVGYSLPGSTNPRTVNTTATAIVTSAAATLITTSTVADTTAAMGDGCKIILPDLIDLAATGQTTTYLPGDDGDLQAGVAWPSPRFVDLGDGTMRDMLTGLVWLKDGGCVESSGYDTDWLVTWYEAFAFVDDLNAGVVNTSACGYTGSHDDWRVPNIKEMESLVNAEPTGALTWLEQYGFTNVCGPYGNWDYWTSSTRVTSSAWRVMANGQTGSRYKDDYHMAGAWPVREGQDEIPDPTYPANLARTGQTYDDPDVTGEDGELQMGVNWPAPRFFNNGGGTITDGVTGLVWLKDVDCIGHLEWPDALAAVADFNTNPGNYICAGYSGDADDWRLPNRRELLSLIQYNAESLLWPLPEDHPFVGLGDTSFDHWTSTTYAVDPAQAWYVFFANGGLNFTTKDYYYNHAVWLVRTPGDTDGDGILDEEDNCILVANGPVIPDAGGNSQLDVDDDGYGNICDPDFDQSGVVNAADLAYLKVNFFTTDPLADLTGDGIVNAADLAILKTMFFKPPGPSCCGDVLP